MKKSKNIVIKLSSNLLKPGNDIIDKLVKEISILKEKGFKIIIVTSGAVMHGVKTLNLEKKPSLLPQLQASAAIGQIKLMNRYQSVFEKYNLICAQILVSIDDFRIRKRYLNLRNAIESLLEVNAIPIFNENDSINTEELKFGDNDHLSSLITIMANFNLLIILTNVKGLFNKDPNQYNDAELITSITDMDEKYLNLAGNNISKFSSGGMKTKLESSLKASRAGIDVFIGNGFNISLLKIIENNEIGTYIKGNSEKTNARKKWIASSPAEKGSIVIDEGAYKALKNNYSLLASGIINITGNFNKGSLISITYINKKIAQGLTNFSSKDLELIKGKKTSEFGKYLKNYDYNEVIHKNNLYLL